MLRLLLIPYWLSNNAQKVLLRFAAFHKIQQAYAKHILGTPDKPLGFSSNLLCGSFAGAFEAALVRFAMKFHFYNLLVRVNPEWTPWKGGSKWDVHLWFWMTNPILRYNREIDCTTFRKRKNFACRFSFSIQHLCRLFPRTWFLWWYESGLYWLCAMLSTPGAQSSNRTSSHLFSQKLVVIKVWKKQKVI